MAQKDGPIAGSGWKLAAEARRESFQAFVRRAIQSQAIAAEAEAASAKADIAQLSRRLVALERQVRASSGRLTELSSIEELQPFANQQFDRIAALPRVAALALAETSLEVQTEPIELEWEERRYRLGDYRLTIDLRGDVRVDSLAHLGPKPGWDHPHVQDGLPCLGNLRPGILKLIAELELALATQLLLDFLVTYQPETAYTPIEGWPEA